jgi:hypothetical protein
VFNVIYKSRSEQPYQPEDIFDTLASAVRKLYCAPINHGYNAQLICIGLLQYEEEIHVVSHQALSWKIAGVSD